MGTADIDDRIDNQTQTRYNLKNNDNWYHRNRRLSATSLSNTIILLASRFTAHTRLMQAFNLVHANAKQKLKIKLVTSEHKLLL